jgi:hypothetical protein
MAVALIVLPSHSAASLISSKKDTKGTTPRPWSCWGLKSSKMNGGKRTVKSTSKIALFMSPAPVLTRYSQEVFGLRSGAEQRRKTRVFCRALAFRRN